MPFGALAIDGGPGGRRKVAFFPRQSGCGLVYVKNRPHPQVRGIGLDVGVFERVLQRANAARCLVSAAIRFTRPPMGILK